MGMHNVRLYAETRIHQPANQVQKVQQTDYYGLDLQVYLNKGDEI